MEMDSSSTNPKQPHPHFVVIPWPATSHMIPILDVACLLAAHGARVTVINSPANAPLIQSRLAAADHEITLTTIPFPAAAESGIPDGCERVDHLPSPSMLPAFFSAAMKFGDAVSRHFRHRRSPRPDCIVAGISHTWAQSMAREMGVPCFIFQGFCAFSLLCCELLHAHKPHESAAISPDEPFVVPALPPPFDACCRLTARQVPLQFLPDCPVPDRMREYREFELAVDGIVVNSFEEMEHDAVSRLAAVTGKKVFAVGPVSLSRRAPSLATADTTARRCAAWLDAKKEKSVIYVSFGSAGRMPPAQLTQLGKALVSCPWPVLWVIKGAATGEDIANNTDEEGDVASQCLVVRGWAPQVAILSHGAVGGFVTHCGWGSTLESVAAGVPMVTWPFTAEQFVNERLVVDVLRIGASVGATRPTGGMMMAGGEEEAEVGTEQVRRALESLMNGGVEGEERVKRVKELKAMAHAALEKGGSSYMNLDKLIRSVV
uniref:Glycosyltransferase n=1 Tax=Leersia perrieri TaxID=77586 RepID=A0A0D9X5W1_9ORYZ